MQQSYGLRLAREPHPPHGSSTGSMWFYRGVFKRIHMFPMDDPPRVCGAWGNHIPCELKRNLSIPMLNPTGVCACMGDFSNDSTEMGTSSPWVIHRGDVVSFAPAINENLCSPFFRLFRRILLSFSLHTQHFACHCLYLSFYILLCNFLLPFRSFLFSEIFAPITLLAIHGFKLS